MSYSSPSKRRESATRHPDSMRSDVHRWLLSNSGEARRRFETENDDRPICRPGHANQIVASGKQDIASAPPPALPCTGDRLRSRPRSGKAGDCLRPGDTAHIEQGTRQFLVDGQAIEVNIALAARRPLRTGLAYRLRSRWRVGHWFKIVCGRVPIALLR